MKIKLLVVGKTDVDFVRRGMEEYLQRLTHYVNFEVVTVPSPKEGGTPERMKEREAELLVKQMQQADRVILLDEKGVMLSSVNFAQQLQKEMNSGIKTLMFVVGGAYGFDRRVYEQANGKLSLSPMTFNHQMVRLFFVEQLYRAMTILRGEKYHNA